MNTPADLLTRLAEIAASVAASVDMSLHILARLYTPEVAANTARGIELVTGNKTLPPSLERSERPPSHVLYIR